MRERKAKGEQMEAFSVEREAEDRERNITETEREEGGYGASKI